MDPMNTVTCTAPVNIAVIKYCKFVYMCFSRGIWFILFERLLSCRRFLNNCYYYTINDVLRECFLLSVCVSRVF